MLVYNKDMFDAAGVPYPSTTTPMTVDEYAALAAKLAKPNSDPTKAVFGGTADVPFWWTSRLTHFSEDGRTINGLVNDDATVHMYDALAKMVTDGLAPTPAAAEATTSADLLGTGAIAMAVTDVEVGAKALEVAGNKWGVAPPPVESTDPKPWVFTGTDQWGAFSKAANPEAAKALVAFIGKEGSRIRVEVSDDPPLDSTYLAQWAGDNPGRKEVAEVMALTGPTPLIPGFWDVTGPLADLFKLVVSGEETAKHGLDAQAPQLQDALDQSWATWDAIK